MKCESPVHLELNEMFMDNLIVVIMVLSLCFKDELDCLQVQPG